MDAVPNSTITQLKATVTRYLKKWLNLPRSATQVPWYMLPQHFTHFQKLSLLSCVSRASSDAQLQELGLQLQLGSAPMQKQKADYSLLMTSQTQISSLPTARSLYMAAKQLLSKDVKSNCEAHLMTLTVQSKFSDFTLEALCESWNRLMAGFRPE